MVDPVDRGRDDDARQRPLQPRRQRGVGMMEDGRRQHQSLEQQHRDELDVEQHDHRGAHQRGQDHFAEVEAHGRARVEPFVEMVDDVEAPQQRHLVIGPVPPVDPQVEQQEVERYEPGAVQRRRTPAEAPAVGEHRQRHDEERRQHEIDREQAEIASQPAQRRPRTARRRQQQRRARRGSDPFPRHEQCEGRGDEHGLGGEQPVGRDQAAALPERGDGRQMSSPPARVQRAATGRAAVEGSSAVA